MKRYLERLPKEILGIIQAVGETAALSNSKVYLIGGFIRDLILRVKNFDVDIAVEGDGIAVAEALALRLGAKIITHKRFGTATLTTGSHHKIDIATTRKEFYPEPGCLPVVNAGSLKDDVARRDFTINTLAINISKGHFGELIDSFGGKTDVRNKKIRILHQMSFIDDPTRILRAVRFEQRYGFTIEPGTLACLKEAVRLKMLSCVQPQRLRDEIIPLLKEERPGVALKRLQELAGLGFIHPHLVASQKTYTCMKEAGRQIRWFSRAFNLNRPLDTWLIYFMCLLDGLGQQEVQAVCDRFVFRKGEEKRIAAFFKDREKLMVKLRNKHIRPSTVFHRLEPLSYEVILMLKVKACNTVMARHIEDFFLNSHGTAIALRGHDLHGLGFTPGPHYQKIFRKVLNAKLNGKVSTMQEELDYVTKLKKEK